MDRFQLSKDLKEQGARAEKHFSSWLDRSARPYILVEQSPASMPKHLRGSFKRPDFFVGFPTIGMIGCEVKAFSLYKGAFLFNEAEFENLDNFARGFNIHIWLFFFPPDIPDQCFFIRNGDLAAKPRKRMRGRVCIELEAAMMETARFEDALFQDCVVRAAVQQ